MKAMQYLTNLRPAIPMSVERPCTEMTNGEMRRLMSSGAIRINGEALSPNEEIDFPVFSLVFFRSSQKRRVTLV